MTDATHDKLDRIMAGQQASATAERDRDTVLSTLVAGVRALVPYLETHTEMLRRILDVAGESEDDDGFGQLLKRFEELLTQQSEDLRLIRAALQNLPAHVEMAAQDGVRLAMSDAVEVR